MIGGGVGGRGVGVGVKVKIPRSFFSFRLTELGGLGSRCEAPRIEDSESQSSSKTVETKFEDVVQQCLSDQIFYARLPVLQAGIIINTRQNIGSLVWGGICECECECVIVCVCVCVRTCIRTYIMYGLQYFAMTSGSWMLSSFTLLQGRE